MSTAFKLDQRHPWESHASVSHDNPLSLYVSADASAKTVRIGFALDTSSAGFKITADRARQLAAELVKAADSIRTHKVAA